MKIAAAALALLAVPATAFAPATQKVARANALNSFSYGSETELPPTGLSSPGPRPPVSSGPPAFSGVGSRLGRSMWETLEPVTVQGGGALRTWSFQDPSVRRVQVLLRTEGRPLNANIDLWQGPDNTPHRMGIYIEDGNVRPFCCVIDTPKDNNAIAIRNTGQMEFPMEACVEADLDDSLEAVTKSIANPEKLQGGAIRTYSFSPSVESVKILLRTDGRPLNARIELLQGPNNNKQVIELYTEDGMERPFFAVVETPGVGNVVRVINTAPVEFPMISGVEPFLVKPGGRGDETLVISDDGSAWGSRSLLDR